MTTARERMKALSGLLGAHSAREHFLAITQGTGTGVDRVIFASQMTVCVEEPQMTVVRKPAVKSSSTQVQVSRGDDRASQKHRLDVRTCPSRLDVFTRPDTIFITQRNRQEQFVRSLPSTLSVRQQRTVATI